MAEIGKALEQSPYRPTRDVSKHSHHDQQGHRGEYRGEHRGVVQAMLINGLVTVLSVCWHHLAGTRSQ